MVPTLRRGEDIKIIVALEDDYRAYREVIAVAIKLLRPHVEVLSTGLEQLEEVAAPFDAHLVISSESKTTIHSSTIAWIKVPTSNPTEPTELWLGEAHWEASEPTMEILTQVIDSIEERLAPTEDPNNHLPLPENEL